MTVFCGMFSIMREVLYYQIWWHLTDFTDPQTQALELTMLLGVLNKQHQSSAQHAITLIGILKRWNGHFFTQRLTLEMKGWTQD